MEPFSKMHMLPAALEVTSIFAPGGALRYQMATHCETAARSGSGERQNIGAVNSFEGKKGGRSTSN